MSFMKAIKNLKSKIQKPLSEADKEAKYQKILKQLIGHSDKVYSTATGGSLPSLYIYPESNANIDLIQEMFAELGINLKKHTSHLDGIETEILYISTPDILSLTEHQQKFLEQIAPMNKPSMAAKAARIKGHQY